MSESDAPADLRREFWMQVAIFNVAVLLLGVGLLLLSLTGRTMLGAGLLAVGVLSFVRGYRRYRSVAGQNG